MDNESQPCVKAVRWAGRCAIVEVRGEVDIRRSGEFQQSLLGVLDLKPERVVVNLADVPYMDSAGVASLVKFLARTRRQQIALGLAGLTDRVRGIFEISRLDGVFDIHDTVEEALA